MLNKISPDLQTETWRRELPFRSERCQVAPFPWSSLERDGAPFVLLFIFAFRDARNNGALCRAGRNQSPPPLRRRDPLPLLSLHGSMRCHSRASLSLGPRWIPCTCEWRYRIETQNVSHCFYKLRWIYCRCTFWEHSDGRIRCPFLRTPDLRPPAVLVTCDSLYFKLNASSPAK